MFEFIISPVKLLSSLKPPETVPKIPPKSDHRKRVILARFLPFSPEFIKNLSFNESIKCRYSLESLFIAEIKYFGPKTQILAQKKYERKFH